MAGTRSLQGSSRVHPHPHRPILLRCRRFQGCRPHRQPLPSCAIHNASIQRRPPDRNHRGHQSFLCAIHPGCRQYQALNDRNLDEPTEGRCRARGPATSEIQLYCHRGIYCPSNLLNSQRFGSDESCAPGGIHLYHRQASGEVRLGPQYV
jgi:hypothetical protein